MICSFCGAKVPDGEKTCPACGGAISLAEEIPSPSPYYKEMVGVEAPKTTKRAAKASAPSVEPPSPEIPAAVTEPPVPEPAVSEIPPAPAKWETPIELKSLVDDRSSWAVASLVLGLVGLGGFVAPVLCSLVTSLPAIVLGAMSLKSQRRGMAIAGIVLGILGFVLLIGTILGLIGLFAFSNSLPE